MTSSFLELIIHLHLNLTVQKHTLRRGMYYGDLTIDICNKTIIYARIIASNNPLSCPHGGCIHRIYSIQMYKF